jgi:hypothetical protein
MPHPLFAPPLRASSRKKGQESNQNHARAVIVLGVLVVYNVLAAQGSIEPETQGRSLLQVQLC